MICPDLKIIPNIPIFAWVTQIFQEIYVSCTKPDVSLFFKKRIFLHTVRQESCPMCRAVMGDYRSLLTVAVIERILHDCKNDECDDKFPHQLFHQSI